MYYFLYLRFLKMINSMKTLRIDLMRKIFPGAWKTGWQLQKERNKE